MAEIKYARCPYCYSIIGKITEGGDTVPLSSQEIQEVTTLGLYIWTDDPILVEHGSHFYFEEDGEGSLILKEFDEIEEYNYKGLTPIKYIHIEELQNARRNQELEAGVPEAEQTTFTSLEKVEGTRCIQINKIHIQELRESTEKILIAQGLTKTEYFNFLEDGTEIIRYDKNGQVISQKTDWTNVNLSDYKSSILNLHIEELRHSVLLPIRETFQPSPMPLEALDEVTEINPQIISTLKKYEFIGRLGTWHVNCSTNPTGAGNQEDKLATYMRTFGNWTYLSGHSYFNTAINIIQEEENPNKLFDINGTGDIIPYQVLTGSVWDYSWVIPNSSFVLNNEGTFKPIKTLTDEDEDKNYYFGFDLYVESWKDFIMNTYDSSHALFRDYYFFIQIYMMFKFISPEDIDNPSPTWRPLEVWIQRRVPTNLIPYYLNENFAEANYPLYGEFIKNVLPGDTVNFRFPMNNPDLRTWLQGKSVLYGLSIAVRPCAGVASFGYGASSPWTLVQQPEMKVSLDNIGFFRQSEVEE
jgi:hypothetical protein